MPGFAYVDYNDVEGLKKLVNQINFKGKLRSLVPGKGRKGKRARGPRMYVISCGDHAYVFLDWTGVAGIMMEALQGEGGIRPATKEFFNTVRKVCILYM